MLNLQNKGEQIELQKETNQDLQANLKPENNRPQSKLVQLQRDLIPREEASLLVISRLQLSQGRTCSCTRAMYSLKRSG
jgi:hypothetical protein